VVVLPSLQARTAARFGRAAVATSPTSSHSGVDGRCSGAPPTDTDPCLVDVAQRHPLHAYVRGDERRFGRAVVQLRDYAPPIRRRKLPRQAYHTRRPSETHGGSPSRHPPARCSGDRWRRRAGRHLASRANRHPSPVDIAAWTAAIFRRGRQQHYRPDLTRMDGAVALAEQLARRHRHHPRRHRRCHDLRRFSRRCCSCSRGARVLQAR